MTERKPMSGKGTEPTAIDLEGRRRLAAEMVLRSGGLTPSLEDEEAEAVLNWGLAQAEACALATRGIADEGEARAAIEEGVRRIRRAMKLVNELVGERDLLSDGEMVERLLRLISLVAGMPAIQAAK